MENDVKYALACLTLHVDCHILTNQYDIFKILKIQI